MKRLAIPLAALAALAACSSEEEPVDAVSPSEAKALDEAAEMLEEQRLPADAVEQDKSETQAVEGEDQQ
ncbi:hypothetical protein [Qipengyuania sp. RANM35]|uniref:hypothetical protein n=1 Tax=Qipengyuania sp. RANM35 TaxID=3068635 RepID=UPI0034DB0387